MNDASKRMIRTAIQLTAAGGLTAAFDQLAHNVSPGWSPLVFFCSTLMVTFAQNYCEDQGWVPAVLK